MLTRVFDYVECELSPVRCLITDEKDVSCGATKGVSVSDESLVQIQKVL